MLKQAVASLRFAHFSLACVGLMCVLPYLYSHHQYPLTTFYQEWGAAMLGICAMLLLVTKSYWQQPAIPRIALLPGGVMLIVVLQYLLGKIGEPSHMLLFTLYLVWAALMVMLGQRLREECGLPQMVTVLALCVLAGAELSALAGFIQHYRWNTIVNEYVVRQPSNTMVGNLGQPNHFADYVMQGLVSLGLLQMRWRMRAWQTALLAAPLLFVMVLSGSRSTWVYMLLLCVVSYFWQRRDKANLPLLRYSLLLLLGFGAMHLVVQLPWLAAPDGSLTTIERLTNQIGTRSIRLYIWHEAWLMFSRHPWLGVGFGQFAWHHFQFGPELRLTSVQGIYNNVHNLVMHVAAEMGLAGLLVLFGTLALWARQLAAAPRSIYQWWGVGVLMVLGSHSMFEYPLWYVYFLGTAALVLGMLDGTSFRLDMRKFGRLSVTLMLLLGMMSLSQAVYVYHRWEGHITQRMGEGLGQILLQPYAEVYIGSLIKLDPGHLAEQRALVEGAMHFLPASQLVYNEVQLLALSGETEAAKAQLERAIWAFPGGDYDREYAELRSLAQKDPAHFAALVEFAPKKYEEYQRAVLAK